MLITNTSIFLLWLNTSCQFIYSFWIYSTLILLDYLPDYDTAQTKDSKQKRLVGLQMVVSVLALFFIGNLEDPIRIILRALIFVYMGAVMGYNYKLRQDSDDMINYKYAIAVVIVVSALTFLAIKLA